MTATSVSDVIPSGADEFGVGLLPLLLIGCLGGFGAFGCLTVAVFRRAYCITTAPKPSWRACRAQARARRCLAADLAHMEHTGLVRHRPKP